MEHNYIPDCPEAFLWTEVEDGIKVTGYTGGMDYIAIPAQICGKPVVEIGCGLSHEFSKLFFGVLLPASVKRLDLNAISTNDIPRFRDNYASGWISSLEIHPDNPYLQIRDGILYGDGGSTVLAAMDGAITALEIPAGVTAIVSASRFYALS